MGTVENNIEGTEKHGGNPDEQDFNEGNSTPDCEIENPKIENKFALGLSLSSLLLCALCVALNNTMSTLAIPRITDAFHSLEDVGWYASAYLLTTCVGQLPFGRLYKQFDNSRIFLVAMAIFEIGCVISGAAPNSAAFIVGRAISGWGGGGVLSGALLIIAKLTPKRLHPVLQSSVTGVFAIATVTGPFIGGGFVDRVSWRWVFYINVILGGVASALFVAFVRVPKDQPQRPPFMQMFWRFDPIGLGLFLPSIVCVLLALQLGGTTLPWTDGRIIALFVLFGVLFLAFLAVQLWMDEEATVPPRVLKHRVVFCSAVFSFLCCAANFTMTYFAPIYFQTIRGTNALTSGIDTLAIVLASAIAAMLSGLYTTKTGRYHETFIVSTVLTSIAWGLITTWGVDTPTGSWVGYELLGGFGSGLAQQLPQIVSQMALPPADASTAVAINLFAYMFGGSVFVSVGNNLLDTQLARIISAKDIPDLDVSTLIRVGATGVRSAVPAAHLQEVLEVYAEALRWTFRMGLIIACAQIVPALGLIRWGALPCRRTSKSQKSSTQEGADE